MPDFEQMLTRLSRSRFRSRFHLGQKERDYIQLKGWENIRIHAGEFIQKRLAPASIPNNGHQTPMRGHPVFIAQHACACCCRICLEKWYRVPRGIELTAYQQQCIADLLLFWMQRDLTKYGITPFAITHK